jgi:hypothetical protein
MRRHTFLADTIFVLLLLKRFQEGWGNTGVFCSFSNLDNIPVFLQDFSQFFCGIFPSFSYLGTFSSSR